MSYCRFSTNDFQCDVYVYEGHCYIIHVAANKHVLTEPLPPPISFTENTHAWFARSLVVKELLQKSPLVPIGLPEDGAYFEFGCPKETADKLEELRDMGYRVPQYVIDELRSEAHDDN